MRTLTLVSDAPRVMRLPWELLAESSGPLFTKRPPISIRRRVRLEHAPSVRRFELPLRVLFASARPEGAGFVNPRTVARGVLDALDALGGAVALDFMRPPTLAALDEALRQAESAGRPYHVIHFDGHGVYHAHTSLGQLAFEHDDYSLDLVDANRLGALLNECGVPLVILNACQSAQGDQGNPFSSIATRLIEAGVGGVLSMSHSVLAVTAARFVAAFYDALVGGATIGRAADEARRVLVQDTRRHAISPRPDAPEEVIDLHDWFLPVLYQQRADDAPFADVEARFDAPARAPIPESLADPRVPGGLPPDPLHGFHGRARELLQLERLFRDHPVVVLHGYGGQGKTALAAEAARWLYRVGRFPRGAAFVTFEQGAGDELALSWTRQALLGDDFADAEQVAAALRERPGLIIFDNFESVLPRGNLPLDPADLQDLLDAAWQWIGGDRQSDPDGPRLLITTRDTDLGDPRYAPSRRCAHLELGGLVRHEVMELAKAVLADRGIEHAAIPREPLWRLMDFLGNHPLSLYLVLPHLNRHTPDELVAEFDRLLPGFTAGAAKERNESLAVSLDFSLRRLGQQTRDALPTLGVFARAGLAMEDDLLAITRIDPALWAVARAELVQASLATLEELPGSKFPYVHFHPTLLPYLRARLDDAQRAALDGRYRERYHALASFLYHEDQRNPHFSRALATRDLPNLRRALDLMMSHAAALPPDDENAYAALEAAAEFADSVAEFLDLFGLRRERERLQARLDALVGQRSAGEADSAGEAGALTRAEYLALSRRGEGLWSAGRAREAEQVFRSLLSRLSAPALTETWAYERAITLHRLGRALKAQGRPAEAAEVYRQELAALAKQEQSTGVKRQTGAVHTDLADVLTDLGRYAEARAEYEASLRVKREIGGEERGEAVVLGQLGTLALAQRDYAEARRRYTEALDAFRALGEPESEAVLWHQLGRVAQELRDWNEAERCYREALRLDEAGNNLTGVADTSNQLGLVCKNAGRLAEAETWYRRALAIDEQLGSQKNVAIDYNNLAALLLDVDTLSPTDRPAPFANRDLLAEAGEYARRAAEIVEVLGPSEEPWTTYSILAQIAERRGRPDEARQWRRREQESFAAFAGADVQIRKWLPLIPVIVAACEGSEDASKQAEQQLRVFEKGWPSTVSLVRRILDGERDVEALTAEVTSRKVALIIRRILAALAGEPSPPGAGPSTPPPTQSPTGEGAITLEQIFGLVEAGCGGDTQAGQLAYGMVTQALQAPANPPPIRALGKTLQRILEGLRGEEALVGLPGELRPEVEGLLRRVG